MTEVELRLKAEVDVLRSKLQHLDKVASIMSERYPDVQSVIEVVLQGERDASELRARLACQLLELKDREIDRLSQSICIVPTNSNLSFTSSKTCIPHQEPCMQLLTSKVEISSSRLDKLERLAVAQKKLISKLLEKPKSDSASVQCNLKPLMEMSNFQVSNFYPDYKSAGTQATACKSDATSQTFTVPKSNLEISYFTWEASSRENVCKSTGTEPRGLSLYRFCPAKIEEQISMFKLDEIEKRCSNLEAEILSKSGIIESLQSQLSVAKEKKFPGSPNASNPPLPKNNEASEKIRKLEKQLSEAVENFDEKSQRVISLEKKLAEITRKHAVEISRSTEQVKEASDREGVFSVKFAENSAKLRVAQATIKNLRETCARFQALAEEAAKPAAKPAAEAIARFSDGELSAIRQSLTILSLDEKDLHDFLPSRRRLHE